MTLSQFLSINTSEQDQVTQQFTFSKRNLFQMSFPNTQWNSQYQFNGSVQLGDLVQFQPIQLVYIKNIGTVPIGITGILAFQGGGAPPNNVIALIGPGGMFLQYNPGQVGVAAGTPTIPTNAIGGYNSLFVVNCGTATPALIEFWLGG
jgi:hypothetical protein